MSTRRGRPRSASMPAALASAPPEIAEETPPSTRRRSTRKTTVGGPAAVDVPDTAVTGADSAMATPIADTKKNPSKRKSTVADSETKKPASAKKDEIAESDSSTVGKKRTSRKSTTSSAVKRRSSRKSSVPVTAAIPSTPQNTAKNKSRATTAQRSSMKKATRVTPGISAKDNTVPATPVSSSKKKKSKPGNDADASGSQCRSKRKSSVAFAVAESSPSPSPPPSAVGGGEDLTVTEPLELADGESTTTHPKNDDDNNNNNNVTPQKRVLVDKDVEVPHGKRLKRTVRTEKRQVPVPEEVMKQHELDLSKWECGRLYKTVDLKLSRAERLAEISRQLISSLHFRHVASLSEADAERIIANVTESLKTAPEEPTPRKNPENARLRAQIKELQEKSRQQKLALRKWELAEKVCAEMEKNPVTLPVAPVNVEKNKKGVSKSMSKKGENEARKALEGALLQCAMVDVKLTKLDRIAYDADMKVKAAVDVFNEYVKRSSKLAKTPRKPSAFPRGGEVVAETPRGGTGAGIF